MTAVSLLIQFSLAGFIIQMNWEVLKFTVWSNDENRAFIERQQGSEEREMDDISVPSTTPLMECQKKLSTATTDFIV